MLKKGRDATDNDINLLPKLKILWWEIVGGDAIQEESYPGEGGKGDVAAAQMENRGKYGSIRTVDSHILFKMSFFSSMSKEGGEYVETRRNISNIPKAGTEFLVSELNVDKRAINLSNKNCMDVF